MYRPGTTGLTGISVVSHSDPGLPRNHPGPCCHLSMRWPDPVTLAWEVSASGPCGSLQQPQGWGRTFKWAKGVTIRCRLACHHPCCQPFLQALGPSGWNGHAIPKPCRPPWCSGTWETQVVPEVLPAALTVRLWGFGVLLHWCVVELEGGYLKSFARLKGGSGCPGLTGTLAKDTWSDGLVLDGRAVSCQARAQHGAATAR